MTTPQTIWITGASSGIGEGFASHYAHAQPGCHLILIARRIDELERVAANCRKQGAKVDCLSIDLANYRDLHQALDTYYKDHPIPTPDLLIHSAGISQRSRSTETLLATEEKIFGINYFATVALTKVLLPAMIARKKGRIVVISSLVGKFSTPYRTSYAASKHALHGYFDGLRAELAADNVGITVICPGYITTPISLSAVQGNGEAWGQMDANQARGMPVEQFISRAARAIEAGRDECAIGGKETLGIYLKRFFPTLLNRLVRRVIFEPASANHHHN